LSLRAAGERLKTAQKSLATAPSSPAMVEFQVVNIHSSFIRGVNACSMVLANSALTGCLLDRERRY